MVDGKRLLALFGALMIVIGLLMLRPRRSDGDAEVRLDRSTARKLAAAAAAAGFGRRRASPAFSGSAAAF